MTAVLTRRPPVLFFGLLTLVFGLSGCSRAGGLVTYPVTGRVLVNGKPATAALVTFHPVGGSVDTPRPVARVGANGEFALTTRETGDGAPAGEYRVTVVWTTVSAGKKQVSDGDDVQVRNLLPANYGRPDATPLKATVKAGDNEPLTFEIKTGR